MRCESFGGLGNGIVAGVQSLCLSSGVLIVATIIVVYFFCVRFSVSMIEASLIPHQHEEEYLLLSIHNIPPHADVVYYSAVLKA